MGLFWWRKPKPQTTAVRRDVGLMPAVERAFFGNWDEHLPKTPEERRRTDDGVFGLSTEQYWRLFRIVEEFRQFAFDGELPMWGRHSEYEVLLVPIPSEVWRKGYVDWLDFTHPWNWRNLSIKGTAEPLSGRWHALQTSRVAVERLWPPRTRGA